MKKGLTEISFIVDRSYSMEKIRKEMISGYNSFIQEQKQVDAECVSSFYQFDDYNPRVETVYEGMNLKNVPNLTMETFVPRGNTPLLEAVATVVQKIEKLHNNLKESERPERIMIVIITDGEENSSEGWTKEQVCQMIEHKQQNDHWEFVFLGANQNAWGEAQKLGVKSSSCLGYVATAKGTEEMFNSLSEKAKIYRCCTTTEWTKGINFDDKDREIQKKHGYKH